jgi:hypothetical protein
MFAQLPLMDTTGLKTLNKGFRILSNFQMRFDGVLIVVSCFHHLSESDLSTIILSLMLSFVYNI